MASKAPPGWLKSFATRKKPKLDDKTAAAPAAAGKSVDVSTIDDYMAAELLEVRLPLQELLSGGCEKANRALGCMPVWWHRIANRSIDRSMHAARIA